jgi:SSS family transporter
MVYSLRSLAVRFSSLVSRFSFFQLLLFTLLFARYPDLAAGKSVFMMNNLFGWPEPAVTFDSNSGMQGGFVGYTQGAFIVGQSDAAIQNEDKFSRDLFVFVPDKNQHYKCVSPIKLYNFGAVVSNDDGIILIGGTDGQRCYRTVALLKWDANNKTCKVETLPDLPMACGYASAALLGNSIYVAGGIETPQSGKAMNNFWSMDMKQPIDKMKWRDLPSWPGPGRISTGIIAQNNGDRNVIYIFGGIAKIPDPNGSICSKPLYDCFSFDPLEKDQARKWEKKADIPADVSSTGIVTIGPTHIVFFGTKPLNTTSSKDILAYHTITDTWTSVGYMPSELAYVEAVKTNEGIAIAGTQTVSGQNQSVLLKCETTSHEASFGVINYITLFSYLSLLLITGIYFSRKTHTTRDFFLAGKRIPGWVSGMSIYGACFSAISFMGVPAKSYATNWIYFLGSMTLLPIILLTIIYFIPFFCRLNILTAYEYLEKRFNLGVRLFGSMTFILFQIGRIVIMMLLPAMAMATVTGLSVQFCILTMGILCVVYTTLGGIEAVIWNDCFQVIIFTAASVALMVAVCMNVEGGFVSILSIAHADSKLQQFDLRWDWSVTALWVVIIGNFMSNIAPFATDQSVIQRYLVTPSIKESKKSMWFNFWFCIPNNILFFLIGTALYVFYKHNPQELSPTLATDSIIPLFAVSHMPVGLCGLLIAGIFAASMSSIDSSIHAVTTAIVTDFCRRFAPHKMDKFYLRLARVITVVLGTVGTIIALIMSFYKITSLWDMFMMLLGLTSGGLSGVFLLGMFTRRTNGTGVLAGLIISSVLVFVCQTYTNMHFFLYGAVGLVSTVIVGYLVSLIIPGGQKQLEGLTIYTMAAEQHSSQPSA